MLELECGEGFSECAFIGMFTSGYPSFVGSGFYCSSALCFLSMLDILSSKFHFVKWIYSPLLLEKDCFFKLCYNRVGLYLYASELCGDFIITTLLWLKKSNAMTCIINIINICIVLVTHNFSCHQWITKH